jgi:hypothetical protein
LELDILPFVEQPALTSQRLEVKVNGELIEVFDPVPYGAASCIVPGRLVRGRTYLDILLLHPRASRPIDVGGAPDDRRLAIMFRKLTLTALPG